MSGPTAQSKPAGGLQIVYSPRYRYLAFSAVGTAAPF